MRTSSARNASDPMRRNGFTLVELMVVLAIMALFAGAVVMTIGDLRGGSTDTAHRLSARLAAARDEAIVGGAPIAGWISASGYGFDRFENGRWQPLSVKPFEGGNWEEGTQVTVGGATEARARVRFDSLGLPDAPLSMRLARNGKSSRIDIGANGDVKVQ